MEASGLEVSTEHKVVFIALVIVRNTLFKAHATESFLISNYNSKTFLGSLLEKAFAVGQPERQSVNECLSVQWKVTSNERQHPVKALLKESITLCMSKTKPILDAEKLLN